MRRAQFVGAQFVGAQFVGAQFGAASSDRASAAAALRYALVEPIFWVMLIILVSTAIFQVVYLNKALENYPSTLVIPLHYVLFTIFSITGPSNVTCSIRSTVVR